jgi:hypothetical protein
VVKDCARRLLAGEPVRSIAADLNERGVPSGELPAVLELPVDAQAVLRSLYDMASTNCFRNRGLCGHERRSSPSGLPV